MKKNIWMTLFVISGLLHGMGVDINYDEQIDSNERANINISVDEPLVPTSTPTPQPITPVSLNTLENIELKKLYFQQKIIKKRDKKMKKFVEVKEVSVGSKVTYIIKLINRGNQVKKNIVVHNPMPDGTEYILGTASCLKSCTIRYSADGGQTFTENDKGGESYNYVEFIYSTLPQNKEFRMGFDAIVE